MPVVGEITALLATTTEPVGRVLVALMMSSARMTLLAACVPVLVDCTRYTTVRSPLDSVVVDTTLLLTLRTASCTTLTCE